MSYAVDQPAIAALMNMSTQLQELAERIHRETAQLKSTFEENELGLGAHTAEILTLIEDVEGTEEDASIPVKKLVLRLQRAALIRQQHIESRHYTPSMGKTR